MRPTLFTRMLVSSVLMVLGPACTRRVEETPRPEGRCCTSVLGCLQLLADSTGPVHEEDARSLPLERLDPSKQCAARELEFWGPEAHGHLMRLLFHPAPQVRSGAALVLSSTRFNFTEQTPDAIPALLHAHAQGPPELPLAALVRSDDVRAEPLLRRYLREGPLLSTTLPCVGPTLAAVVVEVLEAPDVTEPVFERGADLLCSSPRKLAPRVRALLRRELARPMLWRSTDPSCQEPLPRTCQLVEDVCMPYAGHLARALSSGAPGEVYPEFMEALARDDERLTPLLLRALARLRSPELDAWRVRLLESPIPNCRLHALRTLLRTLDTPPPHAREVIQSLLERGAPWEREAAASLLARLGDDMAVGALLRALDDPHAGVQAAVARELGSMKQKASVALPRLDALAEAHASPHVRLSAALARFEMTGQWKRPRAYACPKITELDDEPWQRELHLRTGPLRLHSFQKPSRSAPPSSSCADLRTPLFVPMNEACLGLNPGFEGMYAETWVSEKGRHIRLDHWVGAPSPEFSIEFHGKRLVFYGLRAAVIWTGDVTEVARTPQGGWMMTPFAPLPGMAWGHALDSRGNLLVATQDGPFDYPDPGGERSVPADAMPRSYSEAFGVTCRPVLRITRDGQIFDVE